MTSHSSTSQRRQRHENVPTCCTNVGPRVEFCPRPLACLRRPSAAYGKSSSGLLLRAAPVLPRQAAHCRRRQPKIRRTRCTGAAHKGGAAFVFFQIAKKGVLCGYAFPVVTNETTINGPVQFRPLVANQPSYVGPFNCFVLFVLDRCIQWYI